MFGKNNKKSLLIFLIGAPFMGLIKSNEEDKINELFGSIFKKNLIEVMDLVEADKTLTRLKSHFGCTPIHQAVNNKSYNILIYLVNVDNEVINEKDQLGMTPLHWAVRYNDPTAALILLSHKADMSIQDKAGCLPLHWACREKNKEIVSLLLYLRSDLSDFSKKNNSRETPFDIWPEIKALPLNSRL